jgi:hypothetical protein
MSEAPVVTLRYVDVSHELSQATAFKSNEVKDRIGAMVMARLGIAVPEGVRPIEAWLSAMAIANDLPDTRPVSAPLYNALTSDPAAWDFFYALI